MTQKDAANLFPALCGQAVTQGMLINFAGLVLRICEVLP